MKKIRGLITRIVVYYLRFFAKLQLWKFKPLIIGVGGASGKSSLVNLVVIALKGSKYKVKQGMGKNSESGIPLSILSIPVNNYGIYDGLKILFMAPLRVLFDWQKYDVYVAEMGIDSPFEPKNMSYLLKIIIPDIGILTNISLEHSQYFDVLVKDEKDSERREKILKLTGEQESLLLQFVPKNGTSVVNIDDLNIKSNIDKIKSKIITVSEKDKNADFVIGDSEVTRNSFALNFLTGNKKYKLEIKSPLPQHYSYSFVLALAVVSSLGIDTETAIKSIEKNFLLPPGRMTIFSGIKQTTILDSSYNNATLVPLLDTLELLKKIAGQNRKVAILGDMRELGTMSKFNHEMAARKILETCDMAILVGPLMKKYMAPILKEAGFEYYSFETFSEAKSQILNAIKPKDFILIKSSQNTLYLERVVEMLLKDKKDRDKLCRRGEFWDKKREESL